MRIDDMAPAPGIPPALAISPDNPRGLLTEIGRRMAAGNVIPFLGPEVLSIDGEPPVPVGARQLAQLLCSKVGVPGRIRNNLWHTAQYIETFKHRITVDKLMATFFAPVPQPNRLQVWLAGLDALPLIVDTWYDGTLRQALGGRTDWGQVQGASKARRSVDSPWCRAYDAAGAEVPADTAEDWRTVLYKPHGAAQPEGDVLVSDADYVEVLTDIDLQTPIPEAVQQRRHGRGFVFLGCRFYDQILRTFAHQIIKRSGGPHYAVVPEDLSRNEVKFLQVEGIIPIHLPLAEAADLLVGSPPPGAVS
jgi:hypothetical protein